MPTAVRSHAKINLGLGIGAPRPDGFHGLATVYQTLELFDVVTVAARRAPATEIRIVSNDPRVPVDSRNTAWRMAEKALAALGLTAQVDIEVDKRLPIQGGLGAGSANAVAALVGLEEELGIGDRGSGIGPSAPPGNIWEERTSRHGWEARNASQPFIPENWPIRRLELAAQVGSDVPFFLIGGTALGVDRGQQVSPLPDLDPLWCVVACPALGISTPQAFRDWDALCAAEGLTPAASADKLNRLSRAFRSAFGAETLRDSETGSSGVLAAGEDLAGPFGSALVRTGITNWMQNDFERVVFAQYPSLAEIKCILAAPATPEAAVYAALSGSGSTLFGLYKTRGDAEAAQDRLKQFQNAEAQITRTIPRAEYWSGMILEKASSC